MDGSWFNATLNQAGIEADKIKDIFKEGGYTREKDILYADVRQDGLVFVNPKVGNCFTGQLQLANQEVW